MGEYMGGRTKRVVCNVRDKFLTTHIVMQRI